MPGFGAHYSKSLRIKYIMMNLIYTSTLARVGQQGRVGRTLLSDKKPATDELSIPLPQSGLKLQESKASDRNVRATPTKAKSNASDKSVRPTRTQVFQALLPTFTLLILTLRGSSSAQGIEDILKLLYALVLDQDASLALAILNFHTHAEEPLQLALGGLHIGIHRLGRDEFRHDWIL